VSTQVAQTISSGIVNDRLATPAIIFAALVGATLWNLITWLFGLRSSSSHALIGPMWVGAGINDIHFDQVVSKILLPASSDRWWPGLPR
jgi:inorganic phosphate transporter, PiT family